MMALGRLSLRARLWMLAACGLVLATSVVSFNLLFTFIPTGWSPEFGFAPDVIDAYARSLPLPAVTLTPDGLRRAGRALLLMMWAAYLVSALLVITMRDVGGERAALRLAIITGVVASVALIVTPPALSPDLYHYALFGRMLITRGLNPYVTPGSIMVGDPLWPLAGWRDFTTHYGPVFTWLSVVAAWIGAGNAIGTAVAFKTLATLFGALATWAAVAIARREGRSALLPLVLIAWNPLALIETAGSGHNEMVMMGLALAGVCLMRSGRPGFGFVLLVCSVHVKWVTASLAGLVLLARLREVDGARGRAKELARLAAIAIAVTAALYLPFWAGGETVRSVRRLLLASRDAAGANALRLSNLLVFGALAVLAIGLVARYGKRFVLDMSAVVCLAFVPLLFNWLFPWYLLPAMALFSVGPLTVVNGIGLIAAATCSVYLMWFWTVLGPYAR